jgi:hypothetical protein
MKAVRLIDQAIKRLYQLSTPFHAEHFLMPKPLGSALKSPRAALYIAPPTEEEDTLSLGIYLNGEIQSELESFESWGTRWTASQTAAFGTAAEEVSHFNYLVHNAPVGRAVSHLELELQAEVDKFLLLFFADPQSFEELFEKCFEKFSWLPQLTAEQRTRYEEANRLAKAFLSKHAALFKKSETHEKCLRIFRAFYAMSLEGKVSRALP